MQTSICRASGSTASRPPASLVLVGDFNVQFPPPPLLGVMWDTNNLCLLNTDTPVITFISSPDISICVPSLALEVEWQTRNDLCGNDHFLLIMKIPPKDDEPPVEHWKFDRADWMTYALYVCRECLTSWSCLRIQWLSLQTFWLRLQTKPFQNIMFLKTNFPRFHSSRMLANKQVKNVRKLNKTFS